MIQIRKNVFFLLMDLRIGNVNAILRLNGLTCSGKLADKIRFLKEHFGEDDLSYMFIDVPDLRILHKKMPSMSEFEKREEFKRIIEREESE